MVFPQLLNLQQRHGVFWPKKNPHKNWDPWIQGLELLVGQQHLAGHDGELVSIGSFPHVGVQIKNMLKPPSSAYICFWYPKIIYLWLYVIYLSVTSVSFGDDTANSTNWACLNTLFTTSLQCFEIPLNLHMEIPTESIVARVNDIIFEDPAQRSEILPNWLSHPVSFAILLPWRKDPFAHIDPILQVEKQTAWTRVIRFLHTNMTWWHGLWELMAKCGRSLQSQ